MTQDEVTDALRRALFPDNVKSGTTARAHVAMQITRSVANGLGEREFEGILSTSSRDGMDDELPAENCTPKSGNIPLLDGHNVNKVVGRFYYRVSGNRVLGKGVFTPKGICPDADRACGLVKAGIYDSLSVGMVPGEFEYIPGTRNGKRYKSWTPKEGSLVAIPANEDCRITAKGLRTGAPLSRAERMRKAAEFARIGREHDRRIAEIAAQQSANRPARTREERVALARALAFDPIARAELENKSEFAPANTKQGFEQRMNRYHVELQNARAASGHLTPEERRAHAKQFIQESNRRVGE